MYSVVLMMAMTGQPDAAAFGKHAGATAAPAAMAAAPEAATAAAAGRQAGATVAATAAVAAAATRRLPRRQGRPVRQEAPRWWLLRRRDELLRWRVLR